ncbi:MAG: hypothetical protein ACRD3Y_03595, partial [Bryobacteraceae bacterium]
PLTLRQFWIARRLAMRREGQNSSFGQAARGPERLGLLLHLINRKHLHAPGYYRQQAPTQLARMAATVVTFGAKGPHLLW